MQSLHDCQIRRIDSVSTKRRGEVNKWLLGCGAAIAISLLVCAGVAYWTVNAVVKKAEDLGGEFKTFLENEANRQTFQTDWKSPQLDAKALELFPAQVDEFIRQGEPAEASLTEYGIEDPFPHAKYISAGKTVDVYFKAVTPQERRAIFISVLDKLKSRESGFRQTQGTVDSDRLYFSISPPQRTGWIWWQKGWLVFTVSPSEYDSEIFMKRFLSGVSPADKPLPDSAQQPPAAELPPTPSLPEPGN